MSESGEKYAQFKHCLQLTNCLWLREQKGMDFLTWASIVIDYGFTNKQLFILQDVN